MCRFCRKDPSCPQDDQYPPQCSLKVNEIPCSLPVSVVDFCIMLLYKSLFICIVLLTLTAMSGFVPSMGWFGKLVIHRLWGGGGGGGGGGDVVCDCFE